MKNLLRSSLFFLIGLIIVLILNAYTVWLPGNQAIAQLPPLSQGVQQGINLYQAGKYTEAIAFFEQALKQTSDTNQRAIIHTNLATAYRQTGQLDAAIAQWEQAINIYKSKKMMPVVA